MKNSLSMIEKCTPGVTEPKQNFDQKPIDIKLFSNKLDETEIRYEIVVAFILRDENIIWANGSFEFGTIPDLTIFSGKIQGLLCDEERVVDDLGYRRNEKFSINATIQINLKLQNNTGARIETVNQCLKNIHPLYHVFRHGLERNKYVFHYQYHRAATLK